MLIPVILAFYSWLVVLPCPLNYVRFVQKPVSAVLLNVISTTMSIANAMLKLAVNVPVIRLRLLTQQPRLKCSLTLSAKTETESVN